MDTRHHEALDPLVKTITVKVDLVTAFAVFTGEMTAWWPLATHSVGGELAETVTLAPGVGGEIVETYDGGRTTVWGHVTEWDPPHAVAFTWHPGGDADTATMVRVAFTGDDGATEVSLTHTEWQRRPDGGRARRAYDTGWDIVLGRLADRLDR